MKFNLHIKFILVNENQTDADDVGDDIAENDIINGTHNRDELEQALLRSPQAQVVQPNSTNEIGKELPQLVDCDWRLAAKYEFSRE